MGIEQRVPGGGPGGKGVRRGRASRTVAFAVGLALAAGCSSGGGSGGSGGGGDGGGWDEGDTGFEVEAGDLVATVELAAPALEAFVLRATLPLPPGLWAGSGAEVPFAVVDAEGLSRPTQVEAVSRYAAPADGVDVVELIAWVRRPAGVAPGERLRFDVAYVPHPPASGEGDPELEELLETPGSLVLETRDPFGHTYRADLLASAREGHASVRVLRDGQLARQIRTHELLLPVSSIGGSQGTYPHLMGVHAYVTEWMPQGLLSIDLHVHNGMSGADAGDPRDDALQELWFDRLDLRVPDGWTLVHAFDAPSIGTPFSQGGARVHPLVDALPAGDLHVMHRQARFVRRLALCREGEEERALAMVREETLAFCVPATSPGGQEQLSWWNPASARYGNQKHVLPRLEHVGLASIRAGHGQTFEQYRALVESGGSLGAYPVLNPNLGWAHPWGVRYGGMTGGSEIHLYHGVDTAAAASRAGYRFAQLVARMVIDRHRTGLFDLDGEPTTVESWLVEPLGGTSFVPMEFFLTPQLPQHDPFGFGDAPTFHTDAAVQQGRVPAYAGELAAYKPIDFQHYVRHTRNLKTLAWLGNDALAKDELASAAELFRLSYHEHANSPGGFEQASGLRAALGYVEDYPGWGIGFGRGTSWGLDAALAAYSFGDAARRARLLPWFEQIVHLVVAGQSTCTGILQAQPQNGKADGQYRLMQSFECSINENALWSLRETVFRRHDEGRADQLAEVLRKSILAQISPLVWRAEHHGPVSWLALGPYDKTLPPFCELPPDDGNPNGVDHFQLWSSFAYGFRLTGDGLLLQRAVQAAGGGDLSSALHASGLENLENRAALLALVQAL